MSGDQDKETFAAKLGAAIVAVSLLAVNAFVFVFVGIPFAQWVFPPPVEGLIKAVSWLFLCVTPLAITYPLSDKLYRKATDTKEP